MNDTDAELGPIDYLVVEWPKGKQPNGEALPLLVDLVDQGIIHVLDIAFMRKNEDGSVDIVDLAEFGDGDAELTVFHGASSGLLGTDDVQEAGAAIEPGTSAALLVYENAWAAPSRPHCAAAARSSSPTAASRSTPSPPRSTSSTRDASKEGRTHARIASRGRPHRRHRRHRNHGLEPCVAPPGQQWAAQEASSSTSSRRRRPRPAPAASGTDDKLDQLKQLGELKASGVLTEAEFEAQKAKILAG